MSGVFSHAALAIAAAAFAGLWEGTLIAGAVWLGLRCLPKLGAATRYAIWLCALGALVLIPPLTVALAQQPPVLAVGTTAAPADSREASVPAETRGGSAATLVARAVPGSAAVPHTARAMHGSPSTKRNSRGAVAPRAATVPASAVAPRAAAIVPASAAASVAAANAAPVVGGSSSAPIAAPLRPQIAVPPSLIVAIALVWLLLAGARGLRLVLDVRALAVIRRAARPWARAHGYPVLLSDRVHVPLACGYRRPAIILPASLVDELSPDALEAIVLHEVAHLRRGDVWTNALARVAEALVTLNPVAWFVMRRLAMEREIACDDWVVARTGAGDAFARTLAALACGVRARGPLAAPSALGSRHAIVVRIEHLLDARPRRLRLSPPALGGALVLLVLFALVVQSVSPVLAYAAPPPNAGAHVTVAAAGACAVPNRDVRLASFLGMHRRFPQFPRDGIALPDAAKTVARYGAANVATYDLTVDASGRARKVALVSVPRYPGMAAHVTRIAMGEIYLPALRDCAPVAATVRTALRFEAPRDNAYSIVVPTYPKGWSDRHASACKVPTLQHTGVPALPAMMHDVAVDALYSASVRVQVNADGTAANAAVVTSSGQRALDDALLQAARHAVYPLTESSGFKQARPSGTSLAWNAAHGSSTYTSCKPLPTAYVWNTTFGRIVPIGLPRTDYTMMTTLTR